MYQSRIPRCLPPAFTVLTLTLFSIAIAEESPGVLLAEARDAARLGDHQKAIDVLDRVIVKHPKHADALYFRGREHFRAGEIRASFEDFERLIEVEPRLQSRLWERGITCYYAGEFQAGVDQFQAYQGYDDNDVENAVWHFLCLARLEDVESAQAKLLRTKPDPRLPMQAIHELYAGKKSAADVLAAADEAVSPAARKVARFYAHLYIGLYCEATDKTEQAKHHIDKAANVYRISHYMGDVAEVHFKRLATKQRPKQTPAESR